MMTSDERRFRFLAQRRKDLLAEVPGLTQVIRGCYLERFSICSRPGCRCHEGDRHGPRRYVVVTEEKRQKQHYVPQGQERAVLEGIRHYQRLLEIIHEVTKINLELMRLGRLE